MKKGIKILLAFISAAIVMIFSSICSFADSLKSVDGVMYRYSDAGEPKGVYTGWAKSTAGKMYYKKGYVVKKNTVINGIRYKFSSDGYCKGKFTGFTKSSKGRRYWNKGVLAKDMWVQDTKGNYYYAGKDSYLLTGWQEVTRIGGNYSYFDENGIWDGKIYTSDSFDSEDQIVLNDDDEMVVEETSIKEISAYYTDYFTLDDKSVFYSNISNEPSWQGNKWEKSDYIGTIKVKTTERVLNALPSFSANVLPVGTKLYKSTYGGIVVLAELNGKLIPYQKIVEG